MKSFVLIILLFLTLKSQASVWDVKHLWSTEWEDKYSHWIETEVDSDFFLRKNTILYNLNSNCADFVYLTRLYFSYLNNLEFIVRDPARPNKILSNLNSEWDHLEQHLRIKKFIAEVLKVTNVHTIARDTLLAPVNRSNIRPGAILLADVKRAHSWLIGKLKPSGMPILLFATEPSSSMVYESYSFPSEENFFLKSGSTSLKGLGVRIWKWPSEYLVESKRQSTEQTQISRDNFFETVRNKIALQPRTESEYLLSLVDNICVAVQARINVVNSALVWIERNNQCHSGHSFDVYSTYFRDRFIKEQFVLLDEYYTKNLLRLNREAAYVYRSILGWKSNAYYCPIPWASNRTESLGQLREKFLNDEISSDPNHSLSQRWGEKRYHRSACN